MAAIIRTARMGWSSCHHTKIPTRAAASVTISPLVMFFVPYLNERRNMKATSTTPSVSPSAAMPPPPYHTPAVAVPWVMTQMSQV